MNTQEQISAGPEAWRERLLAAADIWMEFAREKASGGDQKAFSLGDGALEALDALHGRIRVVLVHAQVQCLQHAQAHGQGAHDGPARRTPPVVAIIPPEPVRGPESRRVASAAGSGGLKVVQHWYGVDSYRGTWAQLVEAGVVSEDEKPGLPGNGVNQITVAPDGTRRTKGASGGQTMAPGTRTIRRTGKERYCVDLRVPEAEHQRRRDEEMQRRYPSQMRRATEPAGEPSQLAAENTQRAPGGSLRLVWSVA